MELSRASTVGLLLLSLLATSCASGQGGASTSGLGKLAMTPGDLPTGLVRCSKLSGRYPDASSAYVAGSADGDAWRAAGAAGADDGWVEIYAHDGVGCSHYRTASDPAADSGGIIQNLLIDYGDPGTAHRAFVAGHFVPAEPAGFMTPQAVPLYGSVSRGTPTGLGADAYLDSGTVGSYAFFHAAWANGRYVVTLFAEKLPIDGAHAAVLAINGRVATAAVAAPASKSGSGPVACHGSLGSGSGSITGDQLMYPGPQLPPLKIYAIQVGASHGFCYAETASNQRTYSIAGLPPGQYQVVAYWNSGQGTVSGGYTKAVPCGLTAACGDHSLINVSVADGQAVTGINPNDYYTSGLPAQPH